MTRRIYFLACLLLICLVIATQSARAAGGLPSFTSNGYIQAGGINLQAASYSAPLFADWNNDGLPDLIVGEKLGNYGQIRVYLNKGTVASPLFSTFTYAKNSSGTLLFDASGCLGVFPRLYDWNGDGMLDLIAGQADGTIKVLLNIHTANDPVFGPAVYVQAGLQGQKSTVSVNARATPTLADWNNDGKTDLLVGALDGRIRVYLNNVDSGVPNYQPAKIVQMGNSDLLVSSGRSSPLVWDIDSDGKKDLLSGNTDGQICLYWNTGSDEEPKFETLQFLQADGRPINIGSQRSRICLADMNGDGLPDILSGGADGLVRFYQQKPCVLPVIRHISCSVKEGVYYMEIIGVKVVSVTVDFTENLADPVRWLPWFSTNCPSTSLTLTQEITGDSQRFFRVRQLP